ncbi:LTA synthase family protein [Pseudomonas sp. NY15435]|uniref:LTA synthase family protein n=1 Tax=Pseudomonas sp. NY15435 TaxID=3400358 RepID=UPI003A8C806D
MFLSLVTIAVVSWWLDRYSLGLQLNSYIGSAGFFANSLPFVIFFLLLLALTNRVIFSSGLTLLMTAVIYSVNKEKLALLEKPLSIQDAMFLKEIDWSVVSLLGNYLDPRILALSVVPLIVLGVVFVVERRFFVIWPKLRLFILLSSTMATYGMTSGSQAFESIYDYQRLKLGWVDEESSLHAGLMSTLIYNGIKQQSSTEESVDISAAGRIIDKYPACAKEIPLHSADERPDIVVIQSESFFDPAVLDGVEVDANVLPNFRRAKSLGFGGEMLVPTFGGGTLRTEFEVLTGIPLFAYPRVQFPYTQVDMGPLHSMASELARKGYETVAIHGNKGAFWNRKKTFEQAGFDSFLTIDDFPAEDGQEGWFASDNAMTTLMMERLSSSDQPKFIFAISIEAHGPYGRSPVRDQSKWNALAAPAALSKAAAIEYKNYLYHINNADAELGRILDFLEKRKRPYVLAFYGDHLPGFKYIYEEKGFKNGKSAPQQQVPWLIVSNMEGPPKIHVPQSWVLGSNILRVAGYRGGRYFSLTRKVGQSLESDEQDSQDSLISDFMSVARLQLTGKLSGVVGDMEMSK